MKEWGDTSTPGGGVGGSEMCGKGTAAKLRWAARLPLSPTTHTHTRRFATANRAALTFEKVGYVLEERVVLGHFGGALHE